MPIAARAAMTAVESSLGGPQHFSEVNATPSEANVFVVRDGGEGAYVVRDGKVEVPTSTTPYDGPTFAAADVAFGPDVLAPLAKELPDSDVVAFSVTPGTEGRVVDYIATVRAKGGQLRALLGPNGEILDLDVG